MLDEQMTSKLLSYEIISILKKTETKAVYLVKHIETDEIMLMKEMDGVNKIYEKLLNIKQNNLQEIYDVFFVSEKTYLICEYITGETLDKILAEEKLSHKVVKNYIVQLCDAVIALHTNKPPILHRDIKLSNIIISEYEGLKLIDFDTIREYKNENETDTALLGTQGYAAPEQYGFAQTNEKTDIFAIGMVMYKMLGGVDADNSKNYKGKYAFVVKKCLQFDPDKRFNSVREIKTYLSNKIISKHFISIYLSITFILLLGILVFGAWRNRNNNLQHLDNPAVENTEDNVVWDGFGWVRLDSLDSFGGEVSITEPSYNYFSRPIKLDIFNEPFPDAEKILTIDRDIKFYYTGEIYTDNLINEEFVKIKILDYVEAGEEKGVTMAFMVKI